ncbi:non-ribosomal peptide synthetase [Bosea sp. 117]|uniref:non-ribosomal peptide synthetase n=1 Tax=Bosea sp. 117 TaxID=1125973 RepID=UPI00068F3022|nr:non-ribosomal peptide synthetase [Bosea sp. 117]
MAVLPGIFEPRPLTEAQSGLWYAQRLGPANPLFNTGQYIEFRGPLDLDAFAMAVEDMLAEAQALSLGFAETDDGPVQRIDPARRPHLAVVDLSGAADPFAAAEAEIARDMATALEPTREPIARERLFRLGPQRFIWQQQVHHLAIDGYGMILLTQRVADLYNARINGTVPGPALPALAAVFAEDAAYRASPKRAADAEFWRAAFADRPEVASLAPGIAPSAHGFHRESVELTPETFESLKRLGEEAGVVWPDVVTALAAAYCQRHTGTREAIIGVPFMGRLGSAAARVPAMLMNVLPLRVTQDEDAPLHDYLAVVARSLTRARRHGRYRSEQLRRDLKLVGGNRRLHGPLVNILPFDETPRFSGLSSRLEVLSTGPVDDITFTFRLHRLAGGSEGLRLEVDSNPSLYSREETAAHAARLNAFLVAGAGAGRLAEVPTASPDEARRYLFEVNATAHEVPDVTLVDLIAATMQRSPQETAVVFEGEILDFATLDARSSALAGQLAARGVGRGDIVAIALPRSIELIVALVAVLRTGAAHLPLDLAQPDARLARIAASATPRLALVRTVDAGRLAPHVPVLAPEDWSRSAVGPAPEAPRPDDAAYVIYTSGSTGEPKGVVIEHRAIVNRLEWMRVHYGINATDHILQKTPATFDVSVWEFFLPLIAGAMLVVAPPEAHRDPVAIAELIRREGITTLHFVPSMLAAFLAEPSARGIAVRRVFCSGEELPAELRDRFHRTIAGELHNLYGPTEAAVDVSWWPAGPDDRSAPVPIGLPVWNTRLYVLDARLRPVPPGVVGDLYLAGVQLARGYLGRPDLTAERFVPDPFVPGERMYATGDLARWRQDGAVVFLGRSDHQVKLRGLRIELGEIESAIAATGLVRQTAVVAREDRSDDRRIVAYVVPDAGFTTDALRAAIASRVPDYMVPAAFVALDALPVTANGKLDRAALPAPDYAPTGARPLTGETERRVAALFAEQLGLATEPAADDDFFALGGDSLSAVALLLKVREAFGRDPGLGALFAEASVAGLARLIEAESEADAGLGPLVRLADGDPTLPPLFAIHPAGGISWCYGRLARSLQPRRAVYGLQAPALSPDVAPPESLDALAADYVERIRAAHPAGPYHLVGWSIGGIIAHAMAVQLSRLGAKVGIVAMLDSYPADCWRAEPEPNEGAALKALLAIGGHDPDRLPQVALTRASVVAFLRATRSPFGRLPDAALDGVVRVVAGNNRLVRAHHHARYDGPILHVRAGLDHQGRDLRPEQWAPYAARVDMFEVPALHAHLTGAEAVLRIAPALAAAMAAADSEKKEKAPCVPAA